MSVKSRLVEFLDFKNIKKSHFEKELGVSNGYVNSLISAPSAQKLELISKIFEDLDISWLLTGEGAMLKDDSMKIGNVSGNYNKINQGGIHNVMMNSGGNNKAYMSFDTEGEKLGGFADNLRQENILLKKENEYLKQLVEQQRETITVYKQLNNK